MTERIERVWVWVWEWKEREEREKMKEGEEEAFRGNVILLRKA